jgi:hypothetical protein
MGGGAAARLGTCRRWAHAAAGHMPPLDACRRWTPAAAGPALQQRPAAEQPGRWPAEQPGCRLLQCPGPPTPRPPCPACRPGYSPHSERVIMPISRQGKLHFQLTTRLVEGAEEVLGPPSMSGPSDISSMPYDDDAEGLAPADAQHHVSSCNPIGCVRAGGTVGGGAAAAASGAAPAYYYEDGGSGCRAAASSSSSGRP